MAIDTAETRALFVCLALFGQIATQRMQEMHLPESVSRIIFINGRHRAFDGTLSASDTGTVCLGNQFCAPLFFVRPVSGEVKGREII